MPDLIRHPEAGRLHSIVICSSRWSGGCRSEHSPLVPQPIQFLGNARQLVAEQGQPLQVGQAAQSRGERAGERFFIQTHLRHSPSADRNTLPLRDSHGCAPVQRHISRQGGLGRQQRVAVGYQARVRPRGGGGAPRTALDSRLHGRNAGGGQEAQAGLYPICSHLHHTSREGIKKGITYESHMTDLYLEKRQV